MGVITDEISQDLDHALREAVRRRVSLAGLAAQANDGAVEIGDAGDAEELQGSGQFGGDDV